MSYLILTSGQALALDLAEKWWRKVRSGMDRQTFIVAGLAGTGKTTIVKRIVEALGVRRVQYLAPTGKAASRLRLKGNYNAVTIHRFAFNFVGEFETDDGDSYLSFAAKGALDRVPELIVLDEGSMVGAFEAEALLSHGIPMIILGDHGQLEPVRAKAGFDLENSAQVRLEEITRQAADSNIIRAAMFMRQGLVLPEREYSDVKVINGRPSDYDLMDYVGADGKSQIICGRNATRKMINAQLREIQEFKGPFPNIGEKIICTYNDHNRGIMNGELYIVKSEIYESERNSEYGGSGKYAFMVQSLDDGREIEAQINLDCFLPKSEEDEREANKSVGAWDFGSAITCHKSQGSEWDRVLGLDEPPPSCSTSRWRYTLATRASEFLRWHRV